MSEKEGSENNVIFYGDNPVTRVLVTCDGRINPNDGRCNKCLQVAQTTSSHCGRLVEKLSEPVVSQDQEELWKEVVNIGRSIKIPRAERIKMLSERFTISRKPID